MMASEGMSKNEETFVIRRATSLDDLQWVIEMATEEGWTPRKKEAECYFLAGLAPYFYIGELNGKRIGCTSLVKHGESVATGGYYIVAKPYRGSGFGKRMYNFCLSYKDQCNIQTFSLMHLVDYHVKNGFKPGWPIKRYQFTASRAAEGLASCQLLPSVEEILPASQADFEKLFAYSADMTGSSQTCKLLLAAWLCHLQESSWAAIDKNGEVVGYLIMSETTRFPKEGYLIAPLYANSAAIACSLLKVAAEFASANDPRYKLHVDIPVDLKREFVRILMKEEFGAKSMFNAIFMANKEMPSKGLSKVYSFASIDIL